MDRMTNAVSGLDGPPLVALRITRHPIAVQTLTPTNAMVIDEITV